MIYHCLNNNIIVTVRYLIPFQKAIATTGDVIYGTSGLYPAQYAVEYS